ncbi:MAG: hypothetical protein L6Q59_14875 [Ignavibacteriaceae bacterium]|nr:hypothetical protein [Ignavibacteriaceae bacterium]
MNIVEKHVVIIFFLFVIADSVAQDQSSNIYKIGGAGIKIPQPNTDLVEVGYENRELLEVCVPTSNRLVCAFLTGSDMSKIEAGQEPDMKTYAFIEVLRSGEYYDCSQSDFSEVLSGFETESGIINATTFGEVQNEIDRRTAALDAEGIQIGYTKDLGAFYKKNNAFAFGFLMSVETSGIKTVVVCGATIALVKKRLIFIYLYKAYEGNESINWIGNTMEKWTDKILLSN